MLDTDDDLVTALARIVGPDHVLTGADTARYARDWTGGWPSRPRAVVRPAHTAEVAAVMRLAHDRRQPVVPIGGNTGLVGGTANDGALMLSLERLRAIRAIRPASRVAVVEAGVVLAALHEAAAAERLMFPLIFGARGSATIGGALSTNAGGSNVVRYGSTRGLCIGIEAVLADGTVLDLMTELAKDNSGYALRDLIIGAEGTLAVVTAAVMRLVPAPRARATAMVAVPGLGAALDLLNRVQASTDGAVEAFEFMPRTYMDRLALVRPDLRPPFAETHDTNVLIEVATASERRAAPGPDGRVPLAAELEDALAGMVEAGLVIDAVVAASEAQRTEMWARREAAAEIVLGRHPLVDSDVAVPLDGVAAFLERIHAALPGLDPVAETITVAHLGDGNLHFTVWPGSDDPVLKDRIREAVEDVVAGLRGSFSAEHGIGLAKKPTMARRKDPAALAAMRAIKAALDPEGILNPGKVLPDT